MESGTDNQRLADPARLAIIDKLFEYNIGDSVALPQVRPQPFSFLELCWLSADNVCSYWWSETNQGMKSQIFYDQATDLDDSGKSSVLEGLTNLPFPRDSGLCTRFATQITFRRAREQSVAVSLIPSSDAGADHAEKLRAWKKDNLKSLGGSKFSETLTEASSSFSYFHFVW